MPSSTSRAEGVARSEGNLNITTALKDVPALAANESGIRRVTHEHHRSTGDEYRTCSSLHVAC